MSSSSAVIAGECVRESDGIAGPVYHQDESVYSFNGLSSWMLQRLPHQRGCWYVVLYIRGLAITGYAVQDDFGDLQFVGI